MPFPFYLGHMLPPGHLSSAAFAFLRQTAFLSPTRVYLHELIGEWKMRGVYEALGIWDFKGRVGELGKSQRGGI